MLPLLLLQAAAQAVPPSPIDWSALPPLPYVAAPRITPAMAQFVAGEIAAGRCPGQKPIDGHHVVRVDIAALVDAGNRVARALPRAIDCPTVEQYGAGLVQGFARDNLQPYAAAGGERWYRATIVFDWTG